MRIERRRTEPLLAVLNGQAFGDLAHAHFSAAVSAMQRCVDDPPHVAAKQSIPPPTANPTSPARR